MLERCCGEPMSGFRFVVKNPEKGYIGSQLWLPRSKVNVPAIKASLEFEVFGGEGGMSYLQLWEDSPYHVAVPREFLPPDALATLSFPIIDLTPTEFPRIEFESKVKLDVLQPDDDTQKRAWAAFKEADHGLLNLACGKGKTTLALHKVAYEATPTLIIVNQNTILSQWDGAIDKFLEFEGGVGIIQGAPSKWDWRHPIAISTLQTLAKHPDAVTPEMRRWFGMVIWDEVHHLSAPYFCITATMFLGKRFGLSATVNREDGTEVIYNYHIGESFHKDLRQDVKPTIVFKQTDYSIPPEDWFECIIDARGNPNMSKLRVYVGKMEDRNNDIAADLRDALANGRKVLALGHSKAQLKLMYEIFAAEGADVGLCTGDQKVVKRWEALRDRQLIFGTHQLILEAIDEKSLDTLVWMTPFGSQHPEGGRNALQQGMGRIQGYRYSEGMKDPLVIIYDDLYIKNFHRMCNVLRKQMRRWPEDEGGPYTFKNLRPRQEES